jgi:pimeloyl-ACP methyl ester carboxylesterase
MFVEALEYRRMLSTPGDAAQPLARPGSSNWGALWFDGTKAVIGFTRTNGKSALIAAGRTTWVVVPGWTDDLTTTRRLATAIDRTSRKDQVVILDWRQAAVSTGVANAAARVPTVARWAAKMLQARGVAGGNLNLVGHSLGGYMTDHIARETAGGVNRIVVLDPATPNARGNNLGGMDFAARSRFSLALVASSFASIGAAFTADETVRVNVGNFDSAASHAAVPDLFASMTLGGVSKRPGRINPLFSVNRLTPGSRPRWRGNAFEGAYEAVVAGRSQNGHYHATSITYVPRRGSGAVTVNA